MRDEKTEDDSIRPSSSVFRPWRMSYVQVELVSVICAAAHPKHVRLPAAATTATAAPAPTAATAAAARTA
jgi:hypothetical protein